MNVAADQVRETFLAALRLLPERRDAYLHEACPGAENLRERIKRLIQAHEELGSIVDAAATPTSLPAEPPTVSEQAGLVLAGRYELLRKAGEGGMGTVWMARQTEPVKRLVAVKLVKAGMDSKGVLARFEAERQALALMDHPNIAKVLDAGTTPEGRPFFVMELVEGVPITRFCDERRLTPRQRLELFVPVCAAVQHAHQKGILHRDLKPSNLLVAQYDHGAVPKVIDFGLAKAIGQQFAEQTLQTGLGAVVGTLEYMSPEQASFNQLDVDTRSDVYALGVLLYELLAGAPPFSWKEVEGAGVLEMLRLIREQEPTRPSARLSMSEGLPALAASRGTEPGKLTRLVRGELDWIALKALEKDRNRRYESASAFAADVLRYLSDQPVQACPPSAWYRFRKFARRNKRALGTAALLGFMLLVACGAVAGTVGWTLRDRDARRAATAARFDQIVQESERLYREGKLPEANATAKKAQELVEAGSEGEESRRRLRGWLADLEMVARLEAIRGKWQDVWNPGAWQYADAFRAYGIDLDVLPPAETAARIADRPVKVDLAVALDAWACYDPARAQRLRAVAAAAYPDPFRARLRAAAAPPKLAALADLAEALDVGQVPLPVLNLLGQRLWDAGDQRASIAFFRRVQSRHPGDYGISVALGHALFRAKQPHDRSLDEAIRHYAAAIAVRPDSGVAHYFLGRSLFLKGRRDESLTVHRRLVAIDPQYPTAHLKLSFLLAAKGQLDEAIAVLRAAPPSKPEEEATSQQLARLLNDRAWQLATHPDPRAQDPPGAVALAGEAVGRQPATGAYWQTLGVAQYRAGNWKGAIHALEKWGELHPPGRGASELFLAMAYGRLGHQHAARTRYDSAVRWMDLLRPQDPGLHRLRAEADEVLGLAKAK